MNRSALALFLSLAAVACGGAPAAAPPAPTPVALPPPQASTAAPVVTEAPAAPSEDDAAVPVSTHNPTWGSRTALVTIVEFSDFQCPFCARAEPTLAELREKYGPENLRIVWKNNPLPFHPNARPAAEAAMGVFALAGPQAFWRFHGRAFAQQGDLGPESYEKWAAESGVTDLGALRAGIDAHKWADVIDTDAREAKGFGLNGTPSFLINGTELVGAQPIDKFVAVIDAEMSKARAKIEAGTPRARVYAEMARENRANVPKGADEQEAPPPDTKTVFKVPVAGSPVRGNPNALVTIVEFGDFQCPFTGRVQATLDAIRAKYGDKVRVVWKNEPLPFHKNAEPAAQAAFEVRAELGDAGFWKMHDKLFAAQKDRKLGGDAVGDGAIASLASSLAELAHEVGANPDRVRGAVQSHKFARAINADQDLVEDFQATGTPHFFINGRRLVGAQPEEKFDALIDEEIQRAQAVLAAGTPPAGLYDALIRAGQGPTPPETKELPASLPPNDPVRGSPSARVTIHEWADFQCPFCGRAETTVEQVLKEYAGRVRIAWHDLPLPMHPDAPLAAQAAREALRQRGPRAFWALHDLMFLDQTRLKRSDLDGYAQTIGLDMRRWSAALDGGAHEGELEVDHRVAESMGIQGTPMFLVVPAGSHHGYVISGAQGIGKFRKLVERALSEAR